MPFFSSNGANIYYTVDGEGPAVILLHPLPLDRRMWIYQRMLLAANYKTIAMDFRGLGLSRTKGEPVEMATLSADVNNLMKREQVERATVIGLSIGAMVAQYFTDEHPEKVEAMVVAGTNPGVTSPAVQAKFSERIAGYNSTDARSYYESSLPAIFSQEFSSTPLGRSLLAAYYASSSQLDFRCVGNLYAAIKEFDMTDRIHTIKAPTLVLAGEKDRAHGDSRTVAEKISGATFVSVPAAGHTVALENPVVFNDALMTFLRKRAG
jgi:3-oxoadipate enol-lactonase